MGNKYIRPVVPKVFSRDDECYGCFSKGGFGDQTHLEKVLYLVGSKAPWP